MSERIAVQARHMSQMIDREPDDEEQWDVAEFLEELLDSQPEDGCRVSKECDPQALLRSASHSA
jgi:hypothetical protein